MIRLTRDEHIESRLEESFAKFAELFGTVGKPVQEDNDMFGLCAVIEQFCDADIPRQVLIILLLHGFHSGECFIISADRYSVYDPAARKADNPPTDIDDEVGRIGRGPLHVEAEWDSASSDGFEEAIEEIDKRLAATPAPANVDELKADRVAVEAAREVFRKDVSQTVEVLKERLMKAGLTEEPTKLSKEERASELGKSPNRPVFWL